MKLTKREAIRECKRIWRLVLEGKADDKHDAIEQLGKEGIYLDDCPSS